MKYFYILSKEDVEHLYDFLQWQHLPYGKPELNRVVSEMGDYVYAINRERKAKEDSGNSQKEV